MKKDRPFIVCSFYSYTHFLQIEGYGKEGKVYYDLVFFQSV